MFKNELRKESQTKTFKQNVLVHLNKNELLKLSQENNAWLRKSKASGIKTNHSKAKLSTVLISNSQKNFEKIFYLD